MRFKASDSLLVLCALIVAAGLLEGLTRLAFPVQYGHKFYSMDGQPISPITNAFEMTGPLTYRQATQEFDKITTHTARGFRGPLDPARPEILFIGDSMTYGIGLADAETIPYLVCLHWETRSCANLGHPGSSTITQIDILEHFLQTQHWRPREVHLMILAMTGALFAGNDLMDNIRDSTSKPMKIENMVEPSAEKPKSQPFWVRIFNKRQSLLEHSNLARVTYYILAPLLRAWFSPEIEKSELRKALAITKAQFERLDALSRRYGFTYIIHVVHPMQDLMRGTQEETVSILEGIAPEGRVRGTAGALMDAGKPATYYYPLDGHLTAEGAARLAAYIATQPRL